MESYYIEGNHSPIVTKELWDEAQRLMHLRAKGKGNVDAIQTQYQNRYPLTGLLLCSKCGAALRRRTWNSEHECRKIVWQCSTYIKHGKDACPGTVIEDAAVGRLNIRNKIVVEEVLKNGKKHYRYTSKSESDKPSGKLGAGKEKSGSVLPGIDRPGRTVIKLRSPG